MAAPMAKREDRLHAAIGEALSILADVAAELQSETVHLSRGELATDVARAASTLITARNATEDDPPRGGGRAYLNARCATCGHARRYHSPHVDPAEPCTYGEADGEGDPCDCTQFKAAT